MSCLCFFPFNVSDGRCGIIVSVPDHCIPFCFDISNGDSNLKQNQSIRISKTETAVWNRIIYIIV